MPDVKKNIAIQFRIKPEQSAAGYWKQSWSTSMEKRISCKNDVRDRIKEFVNFE